MLKRCLLTSIRTRREFIMIVCWWDKHLSHEISATVAYRTKLVRHVHLILLDGCRHRAHDNFNLHSCTTPITSPIQSTSQTLQSSLTITSTTTKPQHKRRIEIEHASKSRVFKLIFDFRSWLKFWWCWLSRMDSGKPAAMSDHLEKEIVG